MWETLKSWLALEGIDGLVGLRFEFGHLAPPWLGAVAVAAVGVGAAAYWSRRIRRLPRAARIGLASMRGAALALALFLALDPCLVGQHPIPSEDYVVFLFDDSKSMRVKSEGGRTRGERVVNAFESARAQLEEQLKQRHQLAYYRFGETPERLADVGNLRFQEPESHINRAAHAVVRDLQGVDVAAVVLFSDGVEQPAPTTDGDEPESAGAPVFTVGVGETAAWRDLEITYFSAVRTDFDKSPVVVTANLRAEQLDGEEAVVEVLDGDRVAQSAKVSFTGPADEVQARLEFVPERTGWIEYALRARLAAGPTGEMRQAAKDPIVENNERRFVIDNRKRTRRILYFAGRPNWENKFFRRAMAEDDTFRVANLIRVSKAETKFVFRGARSTMTNPLYEGFDRDKEAQPRYDESVFIRLGVEESELANGYPMDAETLYGYDLIIWSNIEHGFFNLKHLEATRDFVEKRGGALLLLGGPHAFAEGDYEGSIIEGMLPVLLSNVEGGGLQRERFDVTPTAEGEFTGALTLDANPDANRKRWNEMPRLMGINEFSLIRPGAVVIAEAEPESDEHQQPLFAYQRYGEGKCAVLATGETWQWQMQNEREDQSHERLWRQICRYLVKDVPDPVALQDRADSYPLGAPVALEFLVRDKLFEPQEGLQTIVTVTPPADEKKDVSIEESIRQTGVYSGEFTPQTEGMHLVNLTALDAHGEVAAEFEQALLVEPDRREFIRPKYDPERLEQLAAATGGEHLSLDELPSLADRIPWDPTEHAHVVRIHLWRLPVFYFLLLGLCVPEWYWRRKRGQP